MLAAAPLSAIDHWRKTPFLNLQAEGYKAVPCDQVYDSLPSFNPGRNTSVGPVLYSNGETLAVVKTYEGKDHWNTALREKVAAEVVAELTGRAAPFRIIEGDSGRQAGASLVLDPSAKRMGRDDYDPAMIATSYAAQMLMNDLDFLLQKHTLVSDTHGIVHFDFRAPATALMYFQKIGFDFNSLGLKHKFNPFAYALIDKARAVAPARLTGVFNALAEDLRLQKAERRMLVELRGLSLKRLDYMQTKLTTPMPERVYIGDEPPLKRLARFRRDTVAALKDKVQEQKIPQPRPTFDGALAKF